MEVESRAPKRITVDLLKVGDHRTKAGVSLFPWADTIKPSRQRAYIMDFLHGWIVLTQPIPGPCDSHKHAKRSLDDPASLTESELDL
jgi:hypothetical protein